MTEGIQKCKCGWKLPNNLNMEQDVALVGSSSPASKIAVTISITKQIVLYDCPECGTGIFTQLDPLSLELS